MSCDTNKPPVIETLAYPTAPVQIAPGIAIISSTQAGRGWLVAGEILYRAMSHTPASQCQGDHQSDAHLNTRS